MSMKSLYVKVFISVAETHHFAAFPAPGQGIYAFFLCAILLRNNGFLSLLFTITVFYCRGPVRKSTKQIKIIQCAF
jgi:hypothetical protein